MSTADEAVAVSAAEIKALFASLAPASVILLAVSGGPDSTALMVLAARWRASRKRAPEIIAVTVDHGLRREAAAEARTVKHLAARLGIRHRTVRWIGGKPTTGLQEAAREARYRLLAAAAKAAGASHVLTAHTLDDQAETVLIRMMRGSGLSGLAAMARERQLGSVRLVRPLLRIPKARLIETLRRSGISFADDPSNRDPRFTRARLRSLMPLLAREGLDARRLALLASRVRRAEATLEFAVHAAAGAVLDVESVRRGGRIAFDAEKFSRLPEEVALRLLGRAIAQMGDEGPVELGKLEALHGALVDREFAHNANRLRRTLAGALVTLDGDQLTVERAPSRGSRSPKP